jgi:membrane protease YdiL (CAAX protease family)
MMETPDNRQPPVRLPRERLLLPGPRALWWLVAAIGIAIPFGAHVAGEMSAEVEQADGLTADLRGRTLLWRLITNTQPQQQKKLHEKPDAEAKETAEAEAKDWRELVERAVEIDARKPEAHAREQVIVYALAVEKPERAVALADQVTRLTDDTRALLVGLPGAPTAQAMDDKTAATRLHARDFGRDWSVYQRDQARRLTYERLNDLASARALNVSLRQRDARLVPAWSTVALLFFAAMFVGGAFWFGLLLRAFARRPGMPSALDWLRSRYPGLPLDLPYLTDPLIPWLGLSGWLTGYLLASLLLAVMAGQRSMSGLGVLFESGVGALVAIAVVQNFARHLPGLPHAARLQLGPASPHEPPPLPLAQSLLAAIRVLAALLPAMMLAVLVMALFGLTTGEHPVAGMVFTDTDPLQLGAIGVAVTLLAPLGEELIFRGFLYRALRMRLGVLPALAVTSLAFSMLHPSLGPYFVLSAAFCLAYEWTGSLWTSIILHGLWNGLSFVALVGIAVS